MRYMLFAWVKGKQKGGMNDFVHHSESLLGIVDKIDDAILNVADWNIYDIENDMIMVMPNVTDKDKIIEWAAWKDGQNG